MNTLVLYCHPDPSSFNAAVRDVVVAALRAAGNDVRVRDLYAEGFDPLFSSEEYRTHLEHGPHESVSDHTNDLRWCRHLVLVYPTWWSGLPAMLKGWMDRVLVRGFAWEHPPGTTKLTARLTNIHRITAVATHGASKWVNAIEGEGGKRTISRSLRSICHRPAKFTWLAMYRLDTSTPEQRSAFLAKVQRKLATVS